MHTFAPEQGQLDPEYAPDALERVVDDRRAFLWVR
jgi:hypothetical protein